MIRAELKLRTLYEVSMETCAPNMMLEEAPERTLSGADKFHLRFTLVRVSLRVSFLYFGWYTTAGCLLLISIPIHIALRVLTGMKVPVMPCGLLVVISGILAGGTLGFRNVRCCFCIFSRLLQFGVLGLWFLHARPCLFSTQAAVNSTRAILSIDVVACFCGFCFGLLPFWFSCLGPFIVYEQILDCVWVHALF